MKKTDVSEENGMKLFLEWASQLRKYHLTLEELKIVTDAYELTRRIFGE